MISDMRTLIDVPDSLLRDIDALAKREQISRAEAVRRAIADYVLKGAEPRPDAAFGIWKSRRIDALHYEDLLRGEWKR